MSAEPNTLHLLTYKHCLFITFQKGLPPHGVAQTLKSLKSWVPYGVCMGSRWESESMQGEQEAHGVEVHLV